MKFLNQNNVEKLHERQSQSLLRKMLSKGFDIDSLNFRKNTLLLEAVSQNTPNLPWVRYLIECGANLDCSTRITRETPILIAIKRNDRRLAEILARSGANLNKADHRNQTPLNAASHPLLADLLTWGADPSIPFGDIQYTLLHKLAERSIKEDIELLPMLDKAGVDVNVLSEAGLCPLHLAVKSPPFTIARWLLERGARVDVVSEIGASVEGWCEPEFLPELQSYRVSNKLQSDTPHLSKTTSRRL